MTMDLFLKCASAVVIMTVLHFLAQTRYVYLSGLVLSCPILSLLAYYFMQNTQGGESIRMAVVFALCSLLPFSTFLVTLFMLIPRMSLNAALIASTLVWFLFSILLLVIWHGWLNGVVAKFIA